ALIVVSGLTFLAAAVSAQDVPTAAGQVPRFEPAPNWQGPTSWPRRAAATSSYWKITAGRPAVQFGSWLRNTLHVHRRSGPIPLSIWRGDRATSPHWRSTGSSLPTSSATGTSWW